MCSMRSKNTHMLGRRANKLLKRFPRHDKKLFMNVVTDDESGMHYFEPHRKISNRVWLTKMQDGLVLPKGLPVKKRLCMPYFSLLTD